MADPLPTDPLHVPGPSDEVDREARIEQLLLSGLDHYFAGEYERATGVWTRVIFLDRHHDRARAYIERARSALAERHREAEELYHRGIAAYNGGDVSQARELLSRAAEQGSDTAHVFLDRLHRVSSGLAVLDVPAERTFPRVSVGSSAAPAARLRRGRVAIAIGVCVVAAALFVATLPVGDWWAEFQGVAPAPSARRGPPPDPLPVVRASESALVRARDLYAAGHLHDALRTLERIDIADPLRTDADLLRSDIQRDLLAAAGLSSTLPTSRP